MRVLFVFKSENFLAPLGLCFISGSAKFAGCDTFLCEVNKENVFKKILEFSPDVIAYSSSTGEAKHYLRINELIKRKFPHIFTIMGGVHPTFFPDVIYEGNLDAICIGEGEIAFQILLNALKNKRSIENIPNIITRNNRDSFFLDNLVENLDKLPFPDYDLIYDNTPLGKYPLKSFITSRGCPYKCTYCFNTKWRELYRGKGKFIRRHSVDYVIENIKYVMKKWPLSTVKFYDDIFVYKADEWLEEFVVKYRRYINLPFFILTRADLLNEEIVKLLKYAGCRTISMSIEAGNPQVRSEILKRDMSDEQIIKAHRICEKYGIYTFTNCIVGIPDTKLKDDIMSLRLSIKCRVTWAEFLIFHPYPGTVLGDYTVRKGYFRKSNFLKMHTSYMNRSPLTCFSYREKDIQRNFSMLASVVVVFPWLFNIVTKILIFLKHNLIFTLIYYVVKMYIIRKKIYVTKINFKNSVEIFLKSLKQEFFRHESKDKIILRKNSGIWREK